MLCIISHSHQRNLYISAWAELIVTLNTLKTFSVSTLSIVSAGHYIDWLTTNEYTMMARMHHLQALMQITERVDFGKGTWRVFLLSIRVAKHTNDSVLVSSMTDCPRRPTARQRLRCCPSLLVSKQARRRSGWRTIIFRPFWPLPPQKKGHHARHVEYISLNYAALSRLFRFCLMR